MSSRRDGNECGQLVKGQMEGIPMTNTDNKLKELILYIALRSEGDDKFGATKLNKLLFYSDFLAYLNFGKAITSHEYQVLPKGPAPRYLVPIRREMEATGDIAISKRDFYGFEQHRVFALRDPNLDLFTAQEIDLVNRLIARYWDVNGNEISEESHQFVGWKYAEVGDSIPYEVALVSDRDLDENEWKYAESLEPIAEALLSG